MTSGEHTKGHTELPWSVSEEYPFMIEKEVIGLADGYDGYVVAEVKKHSLISPEEAFANLDFIVTAVNTYPAVAELVKALEEARDYFIPRAKMSVVKGAIQKNFEHKLLDKIEASLTRFREAQAGGGA